MYSRLVYACAAAIAAGACAETAAEPHPAGDAAAQQPDASSAGGSGVSGADSGAATGAGSGGSVAPPLAPICDLSDTVRFGFTSGGGFVGNTYSFTNPYGNMFLFIGGGCRYYASVDYMTGVSSGTLTQEQIAALTSEVGWDRLREWSSYQDSVCPDAGSSVIMAPGVAATCICQCRDEGPAGIDDAMLKSATWTRTLTSSGELSTGPIQAVAIEQIRPSGHELAWSLDRPITSIADLVQLGPSSPIGFARFDAAADVAALRALRRAALMQEQYAQFVPVLDQGVAYLLFARDDLPEALVPAIDELIRSSQPREQP